MMLNQRFAETWFNGMETMLGMLALAVFLMAHKRFEEHGNWGSTALLSVSAIFCVLTRPELLLTVCILPPLSWTLRKKQQTARQLGTYVAAFGALLFAVLAASYEYFGTPVPLAFYLKAQRGYAGYNLVINPWTYAAVFLAMIIAPALLAMRSGQEEQDTL